MDGPAHVLSKKSARQHRNVFIWCTQWEKLAMGWRVDDNSPITVCTAYRWIITAVQARHPYWKESESCALFPVDVRPDYVLTYSVQQNGSALPRESQEIMIPGDYGFYTLDGSRQQLYTYFPAIHSFMGMQQVVEMNSAALDAKASLTALLAQQALDRDRQSTWIFPPFLGYELSDDQWLENKYYQDPDACDLSELMVIANVISSRKDIATLFWENKIGVDVDDNYRIIIFEGRECLKCGPPLKSHLTLVDGPHRPSDQYLRLHFQRCLAVSVCRGDAREDYMDQDIEMFMGELGVFDDDIDISDPKWATPLGVEVHAYLIREKIAEHVDEEDSDEEDSDENDSS